MRCELLSASLTIFMIVLFLCIFFPLHKKTVSKEQIPNCNKCRYDKCSSSHISLFCTKVQMLNKKLYMDYISRNSNGFREHEKTRLYNKLYGSNMNVCIAVTRQSCDADYCKKECEFSTSSNTNDDNGINEIHEKIINYSNTKDSFIELIKDKIKFESKINDGTFDYMSAVAYQNLADKDNFFIKSHDFNTVYEECNMSLFESECFLYYKKQTMNKYHKS
jgi:hypothetical protein